MARGIEVTESAIVTNAASKQPRPDTGARAPSRRRSVGRSTTVERPRRSWPARVWASVQIPYFS